MNLPRTFKNRIKADVPLKNHTTFRIGGTAKYWFEPRNTEELARFLKSVSLPVFVIGAGSNLLIDDGLIKKVFISLKSADFNGIEIRGTTVTVGAGVKIGRLISALSSKNLGGYEFLGGIPGTIGGALAMNAGARVSHDVLGSYREMKDIVSEVDCLDRSGKRSRIRKKDLKFSYRRSSLKGLVIISAKLKLKYADKKEVNERIRKIILNRLDRQDLRYPSAGSFFRNPDKGDPAGRLIDTCRLKGLSVGGARVSDKHANFIINAKGAKAQDVIRLTDKVAQKVYQRFKIRLLPEVEIVSNK